ncbi:MAG: RluA family pseudouridine synthase [Gammaproteobacteria bacterium]|nr:RluA family pseudouridine synthase [Gammaproteobacteria bacterium]MCP5198371.1 RluA family pseudouridine synthase [Gammaproteobacteria bacterium]
MHTGNDATPTRTRVRTVTVSAEQAGRRLDNFLLGEFKGAPRSLVYKLVRSGQVRVNGKRARPEQRLEHGDQVRLPPVEAGGETAPIPQARQAALCARVLHEDAQFLVVDKPAGLACHAGSGLRYGVIEILRAARPDLPRLDLAHRLDRDTSGCLVLCKSLDGLRAVQAALQERAATKRYLALLRGHLPVTLHSIEASLDITRDARGERRTRVAADGKRARTDIEDCTPCGPHSLVTLRLGTGRMHQIRAHARHIGHPVAGDEPYGDAAFNAEMAALGLDRLFLHAARIVLDTAQGHLDVESPLPAPLAAVVARLQAGADA